MVFGACRRLLGDHHDAEDAFQATFLILARKAASISKRETVANWLYGVALRTALKARGSRTKRRMREMQVTTIPEPEVAEDNLWRELEPLLDLELSRLPQKYRAPVVLCDLEGKTNKEAARQLGCPEGTLSSRLMGARTILARRLARHGMVLSAGFLVVLLSRNSASAFIPTSLLIPTVKAASLATMSHAAIATLINANVAALTKGVLRSMFLTTVSKLTAVVALIAALGFGAGDLVYRIKAAEPAKVSSRAASAEMSRLIVGIQENEALFRNLDANVRTIWTFHQEQPEAKPAGMLGPPTLKESRVGAEPDGSAPLFKPDVQISRIRLTRTVSTEACTVSPRLSLQQSQAEALQLGVEGSVGRGPIGSLTPTVQMTGKRRHHVAVHLAERPARIAVREVPRPAPERPVHLRDQRRDRCHPFAVEEFAQLRPHPCQRLVRGEHVQVAAVAALEVAVVPEREAQEGQRGTGFPQVHHTCLVAVDQQLEATFQRRFHPLAQATALVAGQDDKVIHVPHQVGLRPRAGAVGSMEPMLEPVQVQVGQQGRDHPSNNVAKYGPRGGHQQKGAS